MQTEEFMKELELLVRSRYSLIWIESWEEERVLTMLEKVGEKLNKPVFIWDVNAGMRQGNRIFPETGNGRKTLEHIKSTDENGLYLLLDFHPYLKEGNPHTIRLLRSTARSIKKSFKTVFIISPVAEIPPELEKSVTVLQLPLPDTGELEGLLTRIVESVENNPKLELDADEELQEAMVKAARGLTLAEAENIFIKAAVSGRKLDESDLSLILKEKKQILRKTGVLDYFETDLTLTDVGGLDNLKSWLTNRKAAFSEKARDFGLPQPKGLLLLGVQGCGKSLVSKSIAQMWQIPLLRLDIGSLFSSYIGSTEANMRKAIALAESISPAVLWIDEIEKGLSGLESSGSVDAGVTARVFGSFLSWMQEKTAPVFVVATSNDVSKLPPELLRKGRFDEIFFVDLPKESERRDIFNIHLRRKNRDPESYDIKELAHKSEGYSGAEIEQAVIGGLYDAFAQNEELNQGHLLQNIRKSVPLSVTMAERINSLRSWAEKRAVPAS